MTVARLIKILSKMPGKAKLAVDVSYSGKKDWKYELVEINPTLEPQIEMHSDWREGQRGKHKHIDMCVLGTIVGDVIE